MTPETIQAIAAAVADLMAGKPQPRLLTVKGAAAYLSRTEPAIWGLIGRGVLPTVRMDSRVMLDIRDLDKVIEQSKERAV